MVNIEEKMNLVRWNISEEAHIKVDKTHCLTCPHHACIYACPAACYTLDDDGEISFVYEGCLECGSCYVVCDQGAVDWNYPRGGYGVSFRFV
ncbi:MAG: ferredoxin family protein [Syntrophomonadaceae bacterium]|jgi:ferredoxin like protein|nr:ferredoxin family protein [Syntrophomonadaceae bacterium]